MSYNIYFIASLGCRRQCVHITFSISILRLKWRLNGATATAFPLPQ